MIELSKSTMDSLNSYFTVKDFSSGIFRCERLFNDTTVDVHFIDLTDTIAEPQFNIERYTEKLIAEDYYNNPGDIQWNYYLKLITRPELFQNSLFNKLRVEVESNRTFVRKSIMTPEDLEEWLNFFADGYKIEDPQSDLSTEWINQLKSKKLDGVFLNNSFKDIADFYCSGNPIRDESSDTTTTSGRVTTNLGKLEKLIITKYRKFPNPGSYEIGDVTLLSGPNGAGKTSFMEAIELVTCGLSRRSKNVEPDADLKLVWSNLGVEHYNPGDSNKFRQRDREWYGNVVRKNLLYERFNRFNFHDTDAAYRLSNDKSSQAIRDVLVKLTLGESVNNLDDRIQGTLNAFGLKRRGFNSIVTNGSNEIEKYKNRIASLQKNLSEPSDLLKSIQEKLQSIGWLGFVPNSPKESSSKTIEQLNSVQTWLNGIKELTFISPPLNIQKLEKALEKVAKDLETVGTLVSKANELNSELNNKGREESVVKKKLDILKRLEEYCKLENLSDKLKLRGRIKKGKDQIKSLERILEDSRKLDLANVPDSDIAVSDLLEKIDQLCYDRNGKLEELKKAVETVKKELGRVKSILSELKVSVDKLLEDSEDIESCPVCGKDTSADEINVHLAKQLSEIGAGEKDQELQKQLKVISELEKKIKTDRNQQSKIREALNLFRELEPSEEINPTYSEVVEKLASVPGLIDSRNKLLNDLISQLNQFETDGYSLTEFQEVIEGLGEEKSKFNFDNASNFVATEIDKLEKLLTSVGKRKSAIKKETEKHTKTFEKLFDAYGLVSTETNELLKVVRSRQVRIESVLAEYGDQSKIIDFNDKTNLEKLLKSLSETKSGVEGYVEQSDTYQKNEKIIRSEQDELKVLQKKVEDAKPLLKRCEDAIKFLEGLKASHGTEDALEAFIQAHRGNITKTFKRIHSPREFEDLHISNENILLKRHGMESLEELSRISTGQRAALALSIFFSLNASASKAPNLILIDDPISYIDDLNILSFLDYLRELVLYQKKQIVFATANNKLANLFRKKFSFLSEKHNFIEYPLTR